MTHYTYDQTCWNYAEDQGLGPAVDALDGAGVEWQLFQAGGYNMIITVPVLDGERFMGEYGLTWDADAWVFIWYPEGFGSEEALEIHDREGEQMLLTASIAEIIWTLTDQGEYSSHPSGKGVSW